MLEGESHNVVDTLKRIGQRVAWETLTDDNLDAAEIIGRTPVVLSEDLLSKAWKLQGIIVSRFARLYGSVSDSALRVLALLTCAYQSYKQERLARCPLDQECRRRSMLLQAGLKVVQLLVRLTVEHWLLLLVRGHRAPARTLCW